MASCLVEIKLQLEEDCLAANHKHQEERHSSVRLVAVEALMFLAVQLNQVDSEILLSLNNNLKTN